jgi:hypothetical protein
VIVKIEIESFNADTYAELLPLAQKCWNECSVIKAETCAYHGDRNFIIEPYFDKYDELAKEGLLVLVTLRDEGLKGFAFGFLYNSLHHKSVVCAAVDTMYIEPNYRGYAPVMVAKIEKEFTAMGVELIGWPTTAGSPTFELLQALGYIADDVVMEKRLIIESRGIEKCA